MALDRRQSLVLESVRRFLRRGAMGPLLNLLHKTRPQDFPPIFEQLTDREQLSLGRLLAERDPQTGAGLLVELPQGAGLNLLRRMGAAEAAKLIERSDEDDAAALLGEMDDDEARAILEAVPKQEKEAVEKLLVYDEETAGRIMTSEVFSMHEDSTVSQVITTLQSRPNVEMAFYVYVVDDRDHLVGVLSLRDLLTHPPDAQLKTFMNTDLITMRTDTDQEEVARVAAKYDLLGLPVLDEQGRLVGMVTIDDVIDVLREEATEDILLMAGTSGEERIEPSIWKSVRTRSPWLVVPFFGGLSVSWIMGAFQQTRMELLWLGAFIPLVIAMGGSAGNQAAIVLIRGLATGRVEKGEYLRTMVRELGTAGVLGLVYGSLLLLGSYLTFYFGVHASNVPAQSAVLIGACLAISMTLSTLVGTVLPLILNRVGIDPAISTTPFVTTATDILGTSIFLALATFVLIA